MDYSASYAGQFKGTVWLDLNRPAKGTILNGPWLVQEMHSYKLNFYTVQ